MRSPASQIEKGKLKRNRVSFINARWSMMALPQGARYSCVQLIESTIGLRRRIVPCAVPTNVNPALDRYVGLAAIGRSLRDQYDTLEAIVPPHLAALVKQLEAK